MSYSVLHLMFTSSSEVHELVLQSGTEVSGVGLFWLAESSLATVGGTAMDGVPLNCCNNDQKPKKM